MKKTLVVAVLALASVGASAQLAYPGSNWSNLTYNSNPVRFGNEGINTLLQGNIEQGIVWAKFGDGWRINTYAAMGYSADSIGLPYNNKVTPTLGVKFQRPWESGNLDIGVQAVYQNNFKGVPAGYPHSGTGVQAYVQYWTGWDLKN
jgi:hypothetical protein